VVERLLAASGGLGVDVAVEVAGSDEAVGLSVAAARPGGTVVLAGIPGEDSTTFPAGAARRKGLTLKLSRRMKEMYPRTIGLVERGVVDVRSLVSDTYGLGDVAEAFTAAERRTGLKVVVAPHR
jgi:L-iditol 2-dehydrogenase